MEEELKHFGVLGMKWGRRKGRDDNSPAGKAKTKLENARKTAKSQPANAEAQIAAYRAEVAYNKARGKKFSRPGKPRNQSDEDYDREYDAEVESGLRVIAGYYKAKNKQDRQIVQARRQAGRAAVKSNLDYLAKMAKSKGKDFDEKKEREWLEEFFGDDLNFTVKDLNRQRQAKANAFVATAVVTIGALAFQAVLNSSMKKLA